MCFDYLFNKQWTLRKQLLVSFSVLSVVTLGIVMGIALGNVYVLGDSAQDTAQDALVTQIKSNMGVASGATSLDVAKRLNRTRDGVVGVMARHFNMMFASVNHSYSLDVLPSYYDVDASLMPPNFGNHSDDTRQGHVEFSPTASCVFIPGATLATIDSYIDSFNDTINHSSWMDLFWPSMYINNLEVVQMYVGFENHMLRIYPSQIIPNRTFTPTVRNWYRAAKLAGGSMITTDPYVDAFGKGWMITMAQALYDDYGVFYGVTAADITIHTIQTNILQIGFLQSGYAALLQLTQRDLGTAGVTGLVVAHPLWNSAAVTSPTAQAPVITTIDPWFPTSIITSLINQVTPAITSYINGTTGLESYIVSSPLLTNYAVFTIVPVGEATASVPLLARDIDRTQDQVVGITIGVGVGTILLTFIIAYYTAHTLSRPLEQMVRVAQAITTSSHDDHRQPLNTHLKCVDPVTRTDEMSELVDSFRNMIQQLHEREVKKKSQAKYPANKFYEMSTNAPWISSPVLPQLLAEAKASGAELPDVITRVLVPSLTPRGTAASLTPSPSFTAAPSTSISTSTSTSTSTSSKSERKTGSGSESVLPAVTPTFVSLGAPAPQPLPSLPSSSSSSVTMHLPRSPLPSITESLPSTPTAAATAAEPSDSIDIELVHVHLPPTAANNTSNGHSQPKGRPAPLPKPSSPTHQTTNDNNMVTRQPSLPRLMVAPITPPSAADSTSTSPNMVPTTTSDSSSPPLPLPSFTLHVASPTNRHGRHDSNDNGGSGNTSPLSPPHSLPLLSLTTHTSNGGGHTASVTSIGSSSSTSSSTAVTPTPSNPTSTSTTPMVSPTSRPLLPSSHGH